MRSFKVKTFVRGVACLLAALTGASLQAQTVLIDFSFAPGPDGELGTPDDVPIQNDSGTGGELSGDEFEALGVSLSTTGIQLNIGCGTGPGGTNNCLGADAVRDNDFDGLLIGSFTVGGGAATVATLIFVDTNGVSSTTLFDSGGAVIDTIVGNVDYSGATPVARFETQHVFSALRWIEYSGLAPGPECFLVIGDGLGSSAFVGGSHQFETQVGATIEDFHPVLLDDIPEFVLPTSATTGRFLPPGPGTPGFGAAGVARGAADEDGPPPWMLDGDFAVQVLMWNPTVFPQLPEQYTAGLYVSVLPDGTVQAIPYGHDLGGMQIGYAIDTNAAGARVIRFPFMIPEM